MAFTEDIENLIGAPKTGSLRAGDYIIKNNFVTFGRNEHSVPVIKVLTLGSVLGRKGGFSKWLVNMTYQILPGDITIISEEEAMRIMSIWVDSANVSPVVNENLNTKCVREDTGKPKVTYEGKIGWQRPLFIFRMKHPDGGFQAYECPECGRVHIGKTLEDKKLDSQHISFPFFDKEKADAVTKQGKKIIRELQDINKEWTDTCKQMQILQRKRVHLYREAEELNPGKIVLKVEKAPSIYYDLENNDIDQFLNERIR